MSSQGSEPLNNEQESEAAIAAYLAAHPDFFDRHAELLEQLRIPHNAGGAVSLIEHQLANLRRQSSHYRDQLNELISVARDNEQLQQHLHQLTLAMIEARSFNELFEVLQQRLREDFSADAVALRLFSTIQAHDQVVSDQEFAAFEHFFNQNQPVCGRLKQAQLQFLFGDDAEAISSTAIIPLQYESVLGLLVIGNKNPDHYHSDQSTDYLARLGELACRALQKVATPGI